MAKPYEELTFTDDFMFCKVMGSDVGLCEDVLSLAVGKRVRVAKADRQEPIEVTPDGRGVRLDVYVEGEEGTLYDVEMQASNAGSLERRARYYQAMMDLGSMERGAQFDELPESWVIFICPFDAFRRGLPVYEFQETCVQDGMPLGDGAHKLFLCAKGSREGLDPAMSAFLGYVGGIMSDDGLVRRIDDAVRRVRRHDEWKVEYMALTAWETDALRRGEAKGRAEGLAEGEAEGIAKGVAGAVAMLRRMSVPEAEIRRQIALQYKLTDERAEQYMQAPAEAVEASA